MTQCHRDGSAVQLQIPSLADKPVVVEFSAGQQSSDTGLLVMAALERKYKLIDRLGRHIPDARQQGKVRHSLWELLVQRVLQVAAGYEDCNDADSLRRDPAMKLSCGRLPSDDDLASQVAVSPGEFRIPAGLPEALPRADKVFHLPAQPPTEASGY